MRSLDLRVVDDDDDDAIVDGMVEGVIEGVVDLDVDSDCNDEIVLSRDKGTVVSVDWSFNVMDS